MTIATNIRLSTDLEPQTSPAALSAEEPDKAPRYTAYATTTSRPRLTLGLRKRDISLLRDLLAHALEARHIPPEHLTTASEIHSALVTWNELDRWSEIGAAMSQWRSPRARR